jgi:gamma-glutamyltranspeptidase/glutathione hydrolase
MGSMTKAHLLVAIVVSVTAAWGQNRWQARSMVVSRMGIVATSQTLASQAGAQVLARGGSAADAAIAANAVLAVVEPMSCGMGGDLFAIYWEARTGKLWGLNASGWAPRGLTIEVLKQRGYSSMPQSGILSVSVPGAVEGWKKLHGRFGRLPWQDLFAPAVYYARNGFPVTEIIAEHWRDSEAKLAADAEARRVFLPGGVPPKTGEIFRNPDLARAFELLARQGPDAFYKGPIAEALLRTSRRLGGVLAPEDLSEFEAEWVEPISTTYRGWTVYELPPNSQGIAALEMLNIMEHFPLPEWPAASARAWHVKIEAQKLAYEDLRRYVGDPRFARVPVRGLLSKAYAAERARLIRPDRAECAPSAGSPPPGDTVYLAVVDREGNIASLIQSIYLHFGSGVVVEGMGFHLHNRAALFELDPGHPNALAPRKRPFHTIIPAFMEKGPLKVGFGIMGGYNQAQAHAQFVSYLADHGMNIQAALEAPRFTKLTFGGCDLMMESRVPLDVRSELARLGHRITWLGEFSGSVGGGQVVMHDAAARVNYGASSPRKDGAAVPEPDPYYERGRP